MSVLRNSFFKLLYFSGVGHVLLANNRRHSKVPVLLFHKITPEYDETWPGIHPELLEEIILLLKKHYTIRPLSDLLTIEENDLTKSCFITFDDGYKDYKEYAYPVLKKQGVHSTLFVIAPSQDNLSDLWTSTVLFFVKNYKPDEVREFFISHKCQIKYKKKISSFDLNLAITKYLSVMPWRERKVIMNALKNKLDSDNKIPRQELLTMEEIREFDPRLTTIASHSITHPGMKHETDLDFIEKELKESKDILENELNTSVTIFGFPFGQYRETAINMAKKYYNLCCTTINKPVDLNRLKNEKDYYYDITRYNVHHSSAEEVLLLINGFHGSFGR